MLVTTEERELARQQQEVRGGLPALGLFRNGGEFAAYEGDLNDPVAVLDWLTDRRTLQVRCCCCCCCCAVLYCLFGSFAI